MLQRNQTHPRNKAPLDRTATESLPFWRLSMFLNLSKENTVPNLKNIWTEKSQYRFAAILRRAVPCSYRRQTVGKGTVDLI